MKCMSTASILASLLALALSILSFWKAGSGPANDNGPRAAGPAPAAYESRLDSVEAEVVRLRDSKSPVLPSKVESDIAAVRAEVADVRARLKDVEGRPVVPWEAKAGTGQEPPAALDSKPQQKTAAAAAEPKHH